VVAVGSESVTGGCAALGWQVTSSERGYEVASEQRAPPDAAVPAICATLAARIVLEQVKDDPTGSKVAVNGSGSSWRARPGRSAAPTGAVAH